ncbi:MAG: ABC transporter ATP-binding protein [Chloroflexi bacterium]|nr:ABC transporter ATP-binding protein [Chloroflexota bacterium]
MIRLESLTVRYPGRRAPALHDLSFTVAEGEMVLLLGPSGSGKSTLALALNGLIPHGLAVEMDGRVLVRGRDTREMQPGEIAALVGTVFQDPEAQFCTLTVEDEIAFGLENLRTPSAEMGARIDEALAVVGLNGFRGRRLDRLSGGEKQRLALACILAMRPPIIVLDEPTANLDPLGTREFFAALAPLRGRHILILIEHKLDECAHLADRALVLGPNGSLIADGAPRAVFADHAAALDEFGVWIPQVTEFALSLGLRDHLPLTVAEAAQRFNSPHGLSTKAQGHEDTKKNNLGDLVPSCLGVDRAGIESRSALGISHLSFSYPASPPALRDVSLRIPAGTFAALVGPNGSGKSTLAALAMSLQPPPRGTTHLFGRDVRDLSFAEIAGCAGYVFQNPEHQFVADTVADELAYSLRARRRSPDEITRIVENLLDRFDLAELAAANPFTLSQGQKRRLSVATMLAVGQRLLILDEPTFGQDRRGAARLMALLRDLHRDGATILFITHDMRLVSEHAGTATALAEGRAIFSGPPADLFTRPDILAAARLTLPPMVELAQPRSSVVSPPN